MGNARLPERLPSLEQNELVDNLVVGKRAWLKILDPEEKAGFSMIGTQGEIIFAGYQVLGWGNVIDTGAGKVAVRSDRLQIGALADVARALGQAPLRRHAARSGGRAPRSAFASPSAYASSGRVRSTGHLRAESSRVDHSSSSRTSSGGVVDSRSR